LYYNVAVFIGFHLPGRRTFFKLVNNILAGSETVTAMGRGYSHYLINVANIQFAYAA